MTISSKETGDLYLNAKSFQINDAKHGRVDLEAMGYTQGLGGYVLVKTLGCKKEICIGPCSKVVIFGIEFWGEYRNHPKRQKTKVSLVYP